MIKKIKSIISIVIILSFLCLTQVGFGSGVDFESPFVLKEDFEKTLADYNSRLSAFEAGINSKIDSQVTSYLDRYGIWTKKDQETVEGKKSFLFYQFINEPTPVEKEIYEVTNQGTLNVGGTSLANALVYKKALSSVYKYIKPTDVTKEVVHSITKAGLCVVTYQARTQYFASSDLPATIATKIEARDNSFSSGAGKWWINTYITQGAEYCNTDINVLVKPAGNPYWQGTYYKCTTIDDYYNIAFRQDLVMTQDSSKELYRTEINKMEGSPGQGGLQGHTNKMESIAFTDPLIERTAMFFVEKDKPLYFTSNISFTGWGKDTIFWALRRGNTMMMVIQPKVITVY